MKTINILNGQCMYDYFKENEVKYEGSIIPFNEAMCVGTATEEIFSEDFIKNRCRAHNVSIEEYEKITFNNLGQLLSGDFKKIVLWFDDDMFCQINMLTILAYLDYSGFTRDIVFNLVNNNYEIVESTNIHNRDYYKIYKDVMIKKRNRDDIEIPTLKEGIKLYLEFMKKDNEIVEYIKSHKDCTVQELISKFYKYGLGDTQYIEVMNKCKI